MADDLWFLMFFSLAWESATYIISILKMRETSPLPPPKGDLTGVPSMRILPADFFALQG
ncbi:hypothetical protein I5M27_06560 [Adhaeribacter sp. BT258]|uniref:Uncharacterized protein n=1 Tax=Adhaeribacter terrigena TaxID=2793070 RepID=A0ABS1BZS3_9BACT|nr:hypothetical protein [Adhaeribacter terrigena]MBK0402639.1 hypothetical protein [Adhaeribacter terrigena]